MITKFTDFINEGFQFEHDVEKEFDYLNKLCFNGELTLPPIKFASHKIRIAWIKFINIRMGKRIINIENEVLFFNKKFILTPEQFRNVLCHEMVHLYLNKIGRFNDYGGDHGVFFMQEADRINNMNVGVKVTQRDDIAPTQQRNKEVKKDFYVIFFSYNEDYILCPFSVKEECEKWWNTASESLKLFPGRTPVTLYMGKTNMYEMNHFIVTRKTSRISKKRRISNVKQQSISEELFNKLINETEIYKKETFSRS